MNMGALVRTEHYFLLHRMKYLTRFSSRSHPSSSYVNTTIASPKTRYPGPVQPQPKSPTQRTPRESTVITSWTLGQSADHHNSSISHLHSLEHFFATPTHSTLISTEILHTGHHLTTPRERQRQHLHWSYLFAKSDSRNPLGSG